LRAQRKALPPPATPVSGLQRQSGMQRQSDLAVPVSRLFATPVHATMTILHLRALVAIQPNHLPLPPSGLQHQSRLPHPVSKPLRLMQPGLVHIGRIGFRLPIVRSTEARLR